jgi:uncharacterized membrane protein (Fun14 family)
LHSFTQTIFQNILLLRSEKKEMSSSEVLLFSTGGGFLCGVLAGFAIKKILKIGAIIVGLFLLGLGYLSYQGWINVNWASTENGTRQALVSIVNQTALVVKHMSAQFAAQHNSGDISYTPISAAIGFIIGIPIGFQRG